MIFRPYNPEKDQAAVHRLWRELHWLDSDNDAHAGFMDTFLSASRALVAELDGEAECLVTSVPGSIVHLQHEIPMAIVASVTTGLVARRQGLASRLTARLVAQDAADGVPVSALGMFEQGYYTRLGFGTGPYEHTVRFNPARLNVAARAGVPQRLTEKDYGDLHDALTKRWCDHGSARVHPPQHTHAEMGWTENPRGFGYRNEQGVLTHFIWGSMKDENGPFRVNLLAYRNREQLLELMALLKSLADQIWLVRLLEPVHVQMQDLIDEPLKRRPVTKGSRFRECNNAEAFWQLRINDLAACLASTHLPNRATLSFNLKLTDPIAGFLDDEQAWCGIGGEYTVHLGEDCEAVSGHGKGLPLLQADVSGLSRLWLGCASADVIATSGEISGPQELLDALDRTLSLPLPKIGWQF